MIYYDGPYNIYIYCIFYIPPHIHVINSYLEAVLYSLILGGLIITHTYTVYKMTCPHLDVIMSFEKKETLNLIYFSFIVVSRTPDTKTSFVVMKCHLQAILIITKKKNDKTL